MKTKARLIGVIYGLQGEYKLQGKANCLKDIEFIKVQLIL